MHFFCISIYLELISVALFFLCKWNLGSTLVQNLCKSDPSNMYVSFYISIFNYFDDLFEKET